LAEGAEAAALGVAFGCYAFGFLGVLSFRIKLGEGFGCYVTVQASVQELRHRRAAGGAFAAEGACLASRKSLVIHNLQRVQLSHGGGDHFCRFLAFKVLAAGAAFQRAEDASAGAAISVQIGQAGAHIAH
jgi:hypothetical protein